MSVPNTFASATTAIPLANLDADFAYYDAAFQIVGTAMEVNYTFRLEDLTDPTKKAEFVMSGITTGTTRQYTLPNVPGALVSLGNLAQTFIGATTFAPSNAGSTLIFGSTNGTGAITLGQSTAAQTVSIAGGATAAAVTKTINIGTAGLSTSITNVNIGSAVAGALGTITLQYPTTLLSGDTLTLGAGTTALPPLKFTAGALDTTPEAGAWNYDGSIFYGNGDLTSGRGIVPVTQLFRLVADVAAIGPTIANCYGATSGISLDTSVFYEVEYHLYFTKTTAGTATFQLTFSNAPINANASYTGSPVGGIGAVGAPQTAAIAKSVLATSALPVTGSLTTGVNHYYVVKAFFQANATTAGTLNLQVTSSAGTITPLTGSYYKVLRLPGINTGAFV